ncbi:pre-B-cell leukemia transcription factor-interacting protein 1 [Thalassophryne amazonica]|uniref:pre-B-cell leukemia transcription factor-interacting protein 1 n=1 Tax=Thalassophryne amazonica TaxID=390379 RepID=UPI0014723E1C|nr:pre-B-cell leukemia transcription factor-interacting protein 1 [Thalassophryne amazonica]
MCTLEQHSDKSESVPCYAELYLKGAMSDSNNSTGSTGSSTNSWTLLSPEEVAVEHIGPVDDGTESLGDVPSLSEDVTGSTVELKPSDIPVETVLSEEGHQVCQETAPESSVGPVPSSPGHMSPVPPYPVEPSDFDTETQPPVIHDIVASSPTDNENLGATPFVTSIDLGAPLHIPATEFHPSDLEESTSAFPMFESTVAAEAALDTSADIGPIPMSAAEEKPTEPMINITAETLTAADTPIHVEADISLIPQSSEPPSPGKEKPVVDFPVFDGPAPETIGCTVAEGVVEEEEMEPSEMMSQEQREEYEEEEPSSSLDLADDDDDDGLRRRKVPHFEPPRPRTSDEEDDEEEVEFKIAEKEEDKKWFSMNKCIVGALVLLCLGSLFFTGFLSDVDNGDFDSSDLSDGEQSQSWLSGDPQDMKQLLDKLAQENQQITQLEAQLQSQKEELELALKTVAARSDEKGKEDLEKENAKLKEELSTLPDLRKELESLRARVTELSQLTASQEMRTATRQPGEKDSKQKCTGDGRKAVQNEGIKLKEELKRQKVLLEESGKRLEGMRKDRGERKRVTDSLEEIQKKLSEQVDRMGKKKQQESKWKGKKDKNTGHDHWKKEENKKQRGEKERKQGKEGGWRDEKKGKETEQKSEKQNSHKEAWRKHQEEWEQKKDERRLDREERRKEKLWHNRPAKNTHGPTHQQQHHHHQSRRPHRHNHDDFWRYQEEKVRRNIRPQLGCTTMEDCASKEGLYPVELSEFEELLEGYLSKLEGSPSESKDKIRKLTAEFFVDGVFIHDRVFFSNFAEDVADILEDMADVLDDDGDSLEEEMEEFEREALWKFSAAG